jgi:hypothetical protein
VDEVGEVVGFMRRVPRRSVPAFKNPLALGRCQCAEGAASSAPCGGGVVAHALEVGLGCGIETGNSLLGCLGGLEFGKEGNGVGLALESSAGGGEPPPRDRAENSSE